MLTKKQLLYGLEVVELSTTSIYDSYSSQEMGAIPVNHNLEDPHVLTGMIWLLCHILNNGWNL